jgi:hypothetical protein
MYIEKTELIPPVFRIFYSWQSETVRATNFNFIGESLRNAISRIEAELPEGLNCTIVVDRDTSGKIGTPDIASTIFEKVQKCHLFVGDVTVVHRKEERCYSNNNVLIELGYAAGLLTWDRVACVCNVAHGGLQGQRLDLADLPFDIRGRRILSYNFPEKGDKKSAASQLDKQLHLAIESILEAMGRGELSVAVDVDQVKRQRDTSVLRHVLRNIHRPTFDRFFSDLQDRKFFRDFLFFYYGLPPVVSSNQFQFYDKRLSDLILAFFAPLANGITQGASVFVPSHHPMYFTPGPNCTERELNKPLKLLFTAQSKLKEFLDYVHLQYSEIDLNETDREAWEENRRYIEVAETDDDDETESVAAEEAPE